MLQFENNTVEISDLPALEQVDMQLFHPALRTIQWIQSGIFFGIVFLVAGIGLLFQGLSFKLILLVLIGIGLLALLNMAWIHFAFRYKKFAIRDKDVIYQRGLLFRKVTAIPFNRIQHCEVSQGPVERFFYLGRLNIFTAGGAASDLNMAGFTYEQAQRIRDFVLQRIAHDEEE